MSEGTRSASAALKEDAMEIWLKGGSLLNSKISGNLANRGVKPPKRAAQRANVAMRGIHQRHPRAKSASYVSRVYMGEVGAGRSNVALG